MIGNWIAADHYTLGVPICLFGAWWEGYHFSEKLFATIFLLKPLKRERLLANQIL